MTTLSAYLITKEEKKVSVLQLDERSVIVWLIGLQE